MERKRHAPDVSADIVYDAARWLKAELHGAEVAYSYGSCDSDAFAGYASFVITRQHVGGPLLLEVKITEIAERPFIFANTRAVGSGGAAGGFPLFAEIGSEDGRCLFLNYLSDFLLSTEPKQI